MEHTKKSHYATKFMEGSPNNSSKPYAEVLMGGHRQHHFEGDMVRARQNPMPSAEEAPTMRTGGRMRCRYAEGGNVLEKADGGSTPAEQLSDGKAVGQVFKRGGHARKHRDMGGATDEAMRMQEPLKRAMGGAGKLRKGMMGKK